MSRLSEAAVGNIKVTLILSSSKTLKTHMVCLVLSSLTYNINAHCLYCSKRISHFLYIPLMAWKKGKKGREGGGKMEGKEEEKSKGEMRGGEMERRKQENREKVKGGSVSTKKGRGGIEGRENREEGT